MGPLPRSPRYLTLDHWRGIACLLVVVFHSTSIWALTPQAGPGGALDQASAGILSLLRTFWIGVPIFFVISGYAISATADSSRRRASGAREYMRRRIRRIYPPFWAMLAVQAAIVFAIDVVVSPGLLTGSVAPIERPWTFDPVQWAGNLTLTEAWRPNVLELGSPRAYIIGQSWTLVYEEQFYLVCGALLLLVPRRLFAGAALVTLGVVAAPTLARRFDLPISGFFFDGHWLMFAAGILVYWQINYGSRRTVAVTWLLLGLGLAFALRRFPSLRPMDDDLAVGIVFAAIILVVHRWDARLHAATALRPIQFAGTLCYSMYLSHAVLVRSLSQVLSDVGLTSPAQTLFLVVPACLAIAVPFAWGFHVLVMSQPVSRAPVRVEAGPSGLTADTRTAVP
jgi:peptidoglycan/LPS O-acetylase OafA/YrhL